MPGTPAPIDDEGVESFRRDGFLVVPGVLTAPQVTELRELIDGKFTAASDPTGGVPRALPDVFSQWPEIRWVLFDTPVNEIARLLLGEDATVLVECVAHREGFVGWHRDTSSPERDGYDFQREDDFLMAEFAFYLQDNDPLVGGGLEVVPASHNLRDVPREDQTAAPEVSRSILTRLTRKGSPEVRSSVAGRPFGWADPADASGRPRDLRLPRAAPSDATPAATPRG